MRAQGEHSSQFLVSWTRYEIFVSSVGGKESRQWAMCSRGFAEWDEGGQLQGAPRYSITEITPHPVGPKTDCNS